MAARIINQLFMCESMIPKKPALGHRSEGGCRFSEKIMLKQCLA